MDVGKEYEKNKKNERVDQAIARLSRPYKIWMFFPLWIVLSIFLNTVIGQQQFMTVLKFALNPVALTMTALLAVLGIKFDKDSRCLYQALCVPTDNLNIDYIKKLDYTRAKTGFSIILLCVAACIITILMYSNRLVNTDTACFLVGMEAWWFIKDSDYVIKKMEDDMSSENTSTEQ